MGPRIEPRFEYHFGRSGIGRSLDSHGQRGRLVRMEVPLQDDQRASIWSTTGFMGRDSGPSSLFRARL